MLEMVQLITSEPWCICIAGGPHGDHVRLPPPGRAAAAGGRARWHAGRAQDRHRHRQRGQDTGHRP